MKKNRMIGIVVALMIAMTSFVGCVEVESETDNKIEYEQEKLQSESHRQTGLPNVKNFFEKKMFKKILEMRDNPDLVTYAYTQNMNGKFIYIGQCVGFGLPYSIQYTNPEKIADSYSQGGFAVLPQADPNGLFMPTGLSATWLITVNPETGELEPSYWEQEITVTSTKLPKRLIESWSIPSDY